MYTSNTATQYKYAHTLHSYTTNICTHATQLHNKNMHTCYTATQQTGTQVIYRRYTTNTGTQSTLLEHSDDG